MMIMSTNEQTNATNQVDNTQVDNAEPKTLEDQQQQVQTYTTDEVTRMIEAETSKRVNEALEAQRVAFEQKQAEAEKLKEMDDAQRREYELERRIQELEERERLTALKENRMEASNVMLKRGLPVEFVDYVIADDAQTMLDNINAFEKAFNTAVQKAVEKRISTPTPGAKGNPNLNNAGVTKEQFAKMTLAQRSELYNKNPELFKQLNAR